MRIVLSMILAALLFSACKKNKFTTVPQIKFKSLKPETAPFNLPITSNPDSMPKLTVSITDLEGDIGFRAGVDTSRVYIKNLINNKVDSFFLPDINSAGVKNFEADLTVNLQSSLACKKNTPRPYSIDSNYYEVYVVDFAKNKSNVIKTEKPVLVRCF